MRKALIVLIGFLTMGGCSPTTEKAHHPTPTPTPTVKEDYLEKLQKMAGNFLDIAEPLTVDPEVVEQDVVSYTVDGNDLGGGIILTVEEGYLSFAEEKMEHERLWRLFSTIIPADQRKMVKEFVLFTDGADNTLGFVEPLPADTSQWKLAIDYEDTSNLKDFYYTLIHEFGHLLTLNHNEVQPSSKKEMSDIEFEKASSACETYYALQGCSNQDSYIYQYYKRFWTVYLDEWNANAVETDAEAQDIFFERHIDDFVTRYAVSHPEEDIAESWVHFIFSERPVNPRTIIEKKIAFFYEFPELIQLRATILKNLYESMK